MSHQDQPESLDYHDQRDPVLRFGRLPFDSQLHDPLLVLDHSPESSSHLMSTDPNEPLKFYFSRTSLGRNGGDDRAMYSVKERRDGLNLFNIHPSNSAKVSWKRTVYAADADTSRAIFNVKKSVFNPPTYSVYRGARSGQDLDPADPHAHEPFLRLKANEIGRLNSQYKFYATVKSLRMPSGNAAVDSVLAVERESQLVVLGSMKMRDIYLFLQLGGADKGVGQWRWKNKHAPGQLIAKATAVTVDSVNATFLGPDVMEVQVAWRGCEVGLGRCLVGNHTFASAACGHEWDGGYCVVVTKLWHRWLHDRTFCR